MAVSTVALDFSQPLPQVESEVESWYALHTRHAARENRCASSCRKAASPLSAADEEVHRWSDRKKIRAGAPVQLLCLCQIRRDLSERLRVLRVEGVFGLVGVAGKERPSPIARLSPFASCWRATAVEFAPFLKIGQRVRIRSGALDGMEGVLVSRNGDRTLVISVMRFSDLWRSAWKVTKSKPPDSSFSFSCWL